MDEQEYYRLQFRALASKDSVKVYAANDSFEITKEIDFDSKGSSSTSINYFVAAVLSSIIISIKTGFTAAGIQHCEVELASSLCLNNPLTFLNVQGFDALPSIEMITVKAYVYASMNETTLEAFCKKALERSFICNTLQRCGLLTVHFIVSL